MNQLQRYVVQFTVTDMPVNTSYFRMAFELLILPEMNAGEIMTEIERRCVEYVWECARYRPQTNKLLFSVITTLYTTHH